MSWRLKPQRPTGAPFRSKSTHAAKFQSTGLPGNASTMALHIGCASVPTFALAMTVQRSSPSAESPYLPTNPAIWSEGSSSLPNSSLGHSTTSSVAYVSRSAAMARYDLSVSPHSLATFTNSTGFPAKLAKST